MSSSNISNGFQYGQNVGSAPLLSAGGVPISPALAQLQYQVLNAMTLEEEERLNRELMRLEHAERFERRIAFEKRKRARKEAKAARKKERSAAAAAATRPGGSPTLGRISTDRGGGRNGSSGNSGNSGDGQAQAPHAESDSEEFEMSDTEWEGEVAYMQRKEAEWEEDDGRLSDEHLDEVVNTMKYSPWLRRQNDEYVRAYVAQMAENRRRRAEEEAAMESGGQRG